MKVSRLLTCLDLFYLTYLFIYFVQLPRHEKLFNLFHSFYYLDLL